MKKISAVTTDDGFELRCPKCKHKHQFNYISYNKYQLEDDESDTFELSISPKNTHFMHPIFVCRNVKCSYEDNLNICNL